MWLLLVVSGKFKDEVALRLPDLSILPFQERSVGEEDSLLVFDGNSHFDAGFE